MADNDGGSVKKVRLHNTMIVAEEMQGNDNVIGDSGKL